MSLCHDLEWGSSSKQNVEKTVCKSNFGYFLGKGSKGLGSVCFQELVIIRIPPEPPSSQDSFYVPTLPGIPSKSVADSPS